MIAFGVVTIICLLVFAYCLGDIAKSADEGMKKRLSIQDFEEPT